MKTLTLHEPGRLALSDTPAPRAADLGPGEALVRVRAVGICGTDYHAFRGRQPFFTYPRVLGHELGVEVVAVGDAKGGVAPGDRCAVEPYLECGACIACRRGKPNCCARLRVLGVHCDGGMCEYLIVPARKLHVSRALSFEQLALVETLGIGAHAAQRAALTAGEDVLVIGAGPIGLSVVAFARAAGARVLVRDLSADRLRFCREQFDIAEADALSEPDADAFLAALSDRTGGDLPTAVFDATGSPASMAESFRYVAHGGRLVFVGLFPGDVSFADPEFHRREMTLLASRNSTSNAFREIIGLVAAGTIDTAPWITHRIPADGLPDALPTLLAPESRVVKAVVGF